jgi:hypothetical protein
MEREAEGPLRLRTTAMIIRLWPEAGTAPALRGEIEHLRTGEKRPSRGTRPSWRCWSSGGRTISPMQWSSARRKAINVWLMPRVYSGATTHTPARCGQGDGRRHRRTARQLRL